ncbi:MAG: PLP-dependent transferase [Phycisphaerales bacterium]|nr:PLP-dependent transferase [Phycisphaerales bacterium]
MTLLTTRLAQPPALPCDGARATSTPLYQTATFAQHPDGDSRWDYSRSGNPTRDVLEVQLAALEGARHALACSSGVAALSAVLRLAHRGDHVIVGDDLYGGTCRLLRLLAEDHGVEISRAPLHEPGALRAALRGNTRLVLAESVTNPFLRVVDVGALATDLRGRDVLLAIDNTMRTPLALRPLAHGADLAIQSATKLLNGHGDVTAGVVATDDDALADSLAFRRNAEGTTLAPFEAWLLTRGLQTLPLRLRAQVAGARQVAAALPGLPGVTRVITPDDGSDVVVITLEVEDEAAARALLERTRLFRTTVSFGGVGSSISTPATMSHASMTVGERAAAGITPTLVRLSIGIEDPADLLADLEGALAAGRRCAVAGLT